MLKEHTDITNQHTNRVRNILAHNASNYAIPSSNGHRVTKVKQGKCRTC